MPHESLFAGKINDDARMNSAYYCSCDTDDEGNQVTVCSSTENMNLCVEGGDINYER